MTDLLRKPEMYGSIVMCYYCEMEVEFYRHSRSDTWKCFNCNNVGTTEASVIVWHNKNPTP